MVLNVGPPEVPACDPSGDNIVAELGSEMAKNGNIVSDSDSSGVESQPLGQNAQLEIRTYGSSRGPWRVKPLELP